jgi:hypothetical protein
MSCSKKLKNLAGGEMGFCPCRRIPKNVKKVTTLNQDLTEERGRGHSIKGSRKGTKFCAPIVKVNLLLRRRGGPPWLPILLIKY